MKLIIVTGNKGGVGKSFVAGMLADHIARISGYDALAVSDSEAATSQATFWNICRHNAAIGESGVLDWKLGTQKGFEAMADALDKMKSQEKTVIIDTGASMMMALTENSLFLSEVGKDLGIDVRIVFVAGALPDSVAAAREYLRAQKSLVSPLRTFFLLVSPTETDVTKYEIAGDEKIQSAITKFNGKQLFLGTIRQDYFDALMKEFKWPSEILKNPEVGYGFRKNLDLWLKTSFDPVAGQILGDK